MKSTFKIIFYLKRDKIKQNGKVPIFCRITIDGTATRFSLKAEINPNHWNIDFARTTSKSKEAVDINQILDSTSASLHAVYRKILEKDNYVTTEKVQNSFLGLSTDSTTLSQLYQQHNDDMEKSLEIPVAKATLQKYQVTYKRLEECMKCRYNISDIKMEPFDIISFLHHGDMRFTELWRVMPQISKKVLLGYLKEMENEGLVVRKQINTLPPEVFYGLSDKGESLNPIIKEMEAWINKYFSI